MSIATFLCWEVNDKINVSYQHFPIAEYTNGVTESFPIHLFRGMKVQTYTCIMGYKSNPKYGDFWREKWNYPLDALSFDLLEAGLSVWRTSTWISADEGFDDLKVKFENMEPIQVSVKTCRTHFGRLFDIDRLYRIVP